MSCDALIDWRRCAGDRSQTLSMLERLVELESPSQDKAAVDRCVDLVERECTAAGRTVAATPAEEVWRPAGGALRAGLARREAAACCWATWTRSGSWAR